MEHGGWVGTTAAFIASLIMEYYISGGEITEPHRLQLIERVKNMQFNYGYYDRQQR